MVRRSIMKIINDIQTSLKESVIKIRLGEKSLIDFDSEIKRHRF